MQKLNKLLSTTYLNSNLWLSVLFHKHHAEHAIYNCQYQLDQDHHGHCALNVPVLFLFFNSDLDHPLKLASNCESNQVSNEVLVLTEMSLLQ